jgi:hypothetical protein
MVAARRYLEDLQQALFFHTTLHALMCNISPGAALPEQAVEKYLARPLLGNVSIPRQEMIQASNKGIPLAQAFPQSTLIADLRQIATQVMPIKKGKAV